jgi:hypothetical protein
VNRLYSYSVKHNAKVVLFEDISVIRLKELKSVFTNLRRAEKCLRELAAFRDEFSGKRLARLVTPKDQESEGGNGMLEENISGGMLESIDSEVQKIEDCLTWKGEKKDIPVPKEGLDQDYDKAQTGVDEVLGKLRDKLVEIKGRLGMKNEEIGYCHTKARYEIEIRDNFFNNKSRPTPKWLDFSSKRKGYMR